MQRMTEKHGLCWTKFFDGSFFLTATTGGHPASSDPRRVGALDSRAYRPGVALWGRTVI